LLLAACAGLLEVAQLWIPGRTASIVDFASSAIGGSVGLLLAIGARRAYDFAFIISYE
jgi:VanZ family protein